MTPSDLPYREHVPQARLAAAVDRFWTRRTRAPSDAARILPDGCVDILFHLAPEAPRVVVVGAMTRPRIVPPAPADIVAVRFRPGGAARFFGASIDALTDAHVELSALGIDARRVLDAMLATVGLGPKELARIARAQRVLGAIASGNVVCFADRAS